MVKKQKFYCWEYDIYGQAYLKILAASLEEARLKKAKGAGVSILSDWSLTGDCSDEPDFVDETTPEELVEYKKDTLQDIETVT